MKCGTVKPGDRCTMYIVNIDDSYGETAQPILVSLGAHSLWVATLVVVSDGRGRHLG